MSTLENFTMYTLHETALGLMAIIYITRLFWLHIRFQAPSERQPKTGRENTSPLKGALYSLSVIALPWHLESARRHPFLWAQFILFHLGVATAIGLTIILPYAPNWLRIPPLNWAMTGLIGSGLIVAILRIFRRIRNPYLRAMSTFDDFFSIILLTVWMLLALLSVPSRLHAGEHSAIFFFWLTAFFLLYVPFSKISHYLYYPFGRYFFGKTMGHRGVYPMVRSYAYNSRDKRTRQDDA